MPPSHSGLSQADFVISYPGPSLADCITSFVAYHGREQFIKSPQLQLRPRQLRCNEWLLQRPRLRSSAIESASGPGAGRKSLRPAYRQSMVAMIYVDASIPVSGPTPALKANPSFTQFCYGRQFDAISTASTDYAVGSCCKY